MNRNKKQQRLLFAGDSITDADHLWDPGPDGLGHGYVHMIAEELSAGKIAAEKSHQEFPEYLFINSGFNGFRASDLLLRWEQVCLSKEPDLVTLLVGVNEAGASMEGMVTEPEAFAQTYEKLITEVQEKTGADMILMEPFLFCKPAYLITWRKYFDPLLPVIADLAKKYSLPLIFLDQPFNELARELGEDEVTVDGIHLTEKGNRFLAEKWMDIFMEYTCGA